MVDEPRSYVGIMVSSTFPDLEEHRAAVTTAIEKLGYKAVVMERSGAQPGDVITASLQMVRDSAAYVLLVGHKYGQVPVGSSNPEGLSITELEFNEAVALNRPRLLFVMADDHLIEKGALNSDRASGEKLEAFKARAKLIDPKDSKSNLACIYEEFSSVEDLASKAAVAVARLANIVGAESEPEEQQLNRAELAEIPAIKLPLAPALRALPNYAASHDFVGRRSELETLDDWASPSDSHPILLFEAIGGSGKSMLTWHWLKNHAGDVRKGGWSGKFWYSFYEQGATLAEFCREALAYIYQLPVEAFRNVRSRELADRLLAALDGSNWLLVLDGIERILVGYQRLDAAQLRDEEADQIEDRIADRDPCCAIRPEDDELLRRLSAISGSKLMVSTRLTPAVLINRSGVAGPGVRRELLKGLRPTDAEAMVRACGVTGPSDELQKFLQAHCDCHPLVVGALAGLINAYPPDHGNFLRWRDDPKHGGALNLADCDLVQSRNHILDAAIEALDPKGRELLQGLSLLLGGADYELLLAINPHLPLKPAEVGEPKKPEESTLWQSWDDERRSRAKASFERMLEKRAEYLRELKAWQESKGVREAEGNLGRSLSDLERRGLLQFDKASHRYDLHPVVRGVASGRMSGEDIVSSGSRVVDYCQKASPKRWDDAKTLSDVALGIQTVATLQRMGRFDEAADVYSGSLSNALSHNLEVVETILSLLKGFFPDGWNNPPCVSKKYHEEYLYWEAAGSIAEYDEITSLNILENLLSSAIKDSSYEDIGGIIYNLSGYKKLSTSYRLRSLNLKLANSSNIKERIFLRKLNLLHLQTTIGQYQEASAYLLEVSNLEKPTSRGLYRQGDMEKLAVRLGFYRGNLTESELIDAEVAASQGINRSAERYLAWLRGRWMLERGDNEAAVDSFERAVAMSREVGIKVEDAETALLLARLRNGDTSATLDPERLPKLTDMAPYFAAFFWQAKGEMDLAVAAARKAFDEVVENGEPFVWRWELDRLLALFRELGVEPPPIPVYDPSKDPPFAWEAEVEGIIEKLEKKKAEKEESKQQGT